MAVVVARRPGVVISQETIIERCRKNLAKYKVPREAIFSQMPPANC
jgi:acyl-CoA synthetase (AMP-forming)/AMP-acid ligase II